MCTYWFSDSWICSFIVFLHTFIHFFHSFVYSKTLCLLTHCSINFLSHSSFIHLLIQHLSLTRALCVRHKEPPAMHSSWLCGSYSPVSLSLAQVFSLPWSISSLRLSWGPAPCASGKSTYCPIVLNCVICKQVSTSSHPTPWWIELDMVQVWMADQHTTLRGFEPILIKLKLTP